MAVLDWLAILAVDWHVFDFSSCAAWIWWKSLVCVFRANPSKMITDLDSLSSTSHLQPLHRFWRNCIGRKSWTKFASLADLSTKMAAQASGWLMHFRLHSMASFSVLVLCFVGLISNKIDLLTHSYFRLLFCDHYMDFKEKILVTIT